MTAKSPSHPQADLTIFRNHIYPFVNSSHFHNCRQALTAPSSSTTYKSSPRLLPEHMWAWQLHWWRLASKYFYQDVSLFAVAVWTQWDGTPGGAAVNAGVGQHGGCCLWLDMPCFPSVSCWRTSGPCRLMLCDDLNSLCWTAVTCWTAAGWQRGICVIGRTTSPINAPTIVRVTWVFEGFQLQQLNTKYSCCIWMNCSHAKWLEWKLAFICC